MKTFEHFPEKSICKLCGANDDKECTLVPVDGTNNGGNVEAIPVHVECISKLNLRYNRESNIFYQFGVIE